MNVGRGKCVREEMVASCSEYAENDVEFAFVDGRNDE